MSVAEDGARALIEQLAALAHEQWAGWTEWMMDKWDQDHPSGEPYRARWARQVATPYARLSEDEKENDRIEARKVLALVDEYRDREVAEAARRERGAVVHYLRAMAATYEPYNPNTPQTAEQRAAVDALTRCAQEIENGEHDEFGAEALAEQDARLFPIQNKRDYAEPYPRRIPWAIAERAYSVYSSRYGTRQSLQRLAERGGFSPGEMDMFLPGWKDEVSVFTKLRSRLAEQARGIERLREALSESRAALESVRSACEDWQMGPHPEALRDAVRRAKGAITEAGAALGAASGHTEEATGG